MSTYFDTASTVVDRPYKPTTEAARFWRHEDPILDDAGKVLVGGMFSHQRAWWNLPNYIKVLIGGYGAGKTSIGCKKIISLALQNAPAMVATVSPSFPIARKTVIETLNIYLAGKKRNLGNAFYYRYNRSLHEFYIRYKGRNATILCLSGDNPDSLRGPNLGAALIDEPFIQEKEVFEQITARVRHPDAPNKEILLAGTPEKLSSWGYDLCIGELKDKTDVGIIQASTRLNLTLGTQYVERLQGVLTEKAAQAYIEGKFVNLSEGLVYYGFGGIGSENVKEFEKIPEGAELGVGMDFNVNPMAAAVFWRQGNYMHFFEELELPNADTEFMCDTLKSKPYGNRLNTVYPDATGANRSTKAPGGRSDFWYIKAAGFNIDAPPQNPHVKDRYNAVNGKFKPLKGVTTLTVSPKCKKLIKYMSTYSHEDMNKQKEMSHLLDAMSYSINRLFPINKQTISVQRLLGA